MSKIKAKSIATDTELKKSLLSFTRAAPNAEINTPTTAAANTITLAVRSVIRQKYTRTALMNSARKVTRNEIRVPLKTDLIFILLSRNPFNEI